MLSRLKKLVPSPLVRAYHFALQGVFWLLSRNAIRGMTIIGVTGTKGKTTVVEMTKHILDESGICAASISSVSFQIGSEREENKTGNSMRGRGFIIRFLKKARQKGATHAVLEVTSEGILQSRHRFLPYAGAVFLGIHEEHIERHGGFAAYLDAKLDLFRELRKSPQCSFAVANCDDKYASRFFDEAGASTSLSVSPEPAGAKIKKIGYGLDCRFRDTAAEIVKPDRYTVSADGARFSVENTQFSSRLVGKGNLCNALAAIGISRALDISDEITRRAIASFPPLPGRQEIIRANGKTAVIDYAHTPVSIEALYRDLWEIYRPKRLLCLIGIDGGGRDTWKRPLVGELSAKYCQEIVISDVNPYDEDPTGIAKEIEIGILKYFHDVGATKPYAIVLDRRAAIQKLVSSATEGDIIVSIAKGSEASIAIKDGERLAWNEREEFEKAMKNAIDSIELLEANSSVPLRRTRET